MVEPSTHAFSALLKYWRARRGVSQLDLSIAAEVSTRHISFLETGRSRPSEEMVWQLSHVLDVPMRHRNELLGAAGFASVYPESTPTEALEGPLSSIVELILHSNEPFPTMVLNSQYWIMAANEAAAHLFARLDAPSPVGLNLMRSLFLPGVAEMILNWQDVACDALRRLHREVMYAPDDAELAALFEATRWHEAVARDWWRDGFDEANEPALPLILRDAEGSTTSFMATTMSFNAPRNTALDDLVIETWYSLHTAAESADGSYRSPTG